MLSLEAASQVLREGPFSCDISINVWIDIIICFVALWGFVDTFMYSLCHFWYCLMYVMKHDHEFVLELMSIFTRRQLPPQRKNIRKRFNLLNSVFIAIRNTLFIVYTSLLKTNKKFGLNQSLLILTSQFYYVPKYEWDIRIQNNDQGFSMSLEVWCFWSCFRQQLITRFSETTRFTLNLMKTGVYLNRS